VSAQAGVKQRMGEQRAFERLPMPDAEVKFYPAFFTTDESTYLFDTLISNVAWEQKQIEVPTGIVTLPRLVAWYADSGKSYSYSGVTVTPHAWVPVILDIKQQIEMEAQITFNSVLINQYRDENDSVNWHADDEPELGTDPVIASLSFGAVRPFEFKHKDNPEQRTSIDLTSGSLLLMAGTTQHYWKHRIPRLKMPCGPRINLTFRNIH
jgi:alkylated DNA repair dioxygenase AlkB